VKYIKSFRFWIVFVVVLYTFAGFVVLPWWIINQSSSLLSKRVGINLQIKKAEFNPV